MSIDMFVALSDPTRRAILEILSLFVLPYLNITENSSLEEFEREVLTHPVFLLQSEHPLSTHRQPLGVAYLSTDTMPAAIDHRPDVAYL